MIFKILATSLRSIIAYKRRSLLCVLGMMISVASIVTLLSLINGFNTGLINYIKEGFGTQQIVVTPGKMLNAKGHILDQGLSGLGSFRGTGSTLTLADVEAVLEKADTIATGAPQYEAFTKVKGDNGAIDVILTGTTANYVTAFDYQPATGRFLTDEDENLGSNVVVLGQTAWKELFGEDAAIGNKVLVAGEEFEVVGVMSNKSSIAFSFNDRVYMPVKTMQRLTNTQHAAMLVFKATSLENMEAGEKAVAGIISARHKTSDFVTVKPDEVITLVNQVMLMLAGLATCVTGISLITGGIGIINVMLLTVQERTREIGLRKAVGATNMHILFQFLTESVVLSFIGSGLGILAAYGCVQLINEKIPFLAISMPLWILQLGIAFSIAIGIVFGILPAIKATRVNAIDALRYE